MYLGAINSSVSDVAVGHFDNQTGTQDDIIGRPQLSHNLLNLIFDRDTLYTLDFNFAWIPSVVRILVSFFFVFVIFFSNATADYLRQLYDRIPRKKITVLTMIKCYLVEAVNVGNLLGTVPNLVRTTVGPLPYEIALSIGISRFIVATIILWFALTFPVLKILLLKSRGLIESANPVTLSRSILIAVALSAVIPHGCSYVYLLVHPDKMLSGRVAFLADIDVSSSNYFNWPTAYATSLTLVITATYLGDAVLNYSSVNLKRIRLVTGAFVSIALTHLLDQAGCHPDVFFWQDIAGPASLCFCLSYIVCMEHANLRKEKMEKNKNKADSPTANAGNANVEPSPPEEPPNRPPDDQHRGQPLEGTSEDAARPSTSREQETNRNQDHEHDEAEHDEEGDQDLSDAGETSADDIPSRDNVVLTDLEAQAEDKGTLGNEEQEVRSLETDEESNEPQCEEDRVSSERKLGDDEELVIIDLEEVGELIETGETSNALEKIEDHDDKEKIVNEGGKTIISDKHMIECSQENEKNDKGDE